MTISSRSLAELPEGFASPAAASQAVFRCALEAWSRPGRLQLLPAAASATLMPHAPLCMALAAMLLTLLDSEVSLWLTPSFSQPLVRAWLAFHTGVRLLDDPAHARFVAGDARELDLPLWSRIARGSDEHPQDGATVLLEMQSLSEGPSRLLSGPGMARPERLASRGLPDTVWHARADEAGAYPLGVDLLLCCGDAVAGLPRSTRIEQEA